MAMTPDAALCTLRDILGRIAPDVDLDTIDADEQLLEAGNLDSIDFLGLITALHDATGIDVPERDYPALATMAGFVNYLIAA